MSTHRSRRAVRTQELLDRKGRQCYGKRSHATEAEAQTQVEAIRRAGKARESPGWILRPYRCEKCGLFHLGHGAPR